VDVARDTFVAILWFNPGDHQGVRFCLEAIERGQSWEEMVRD